jgi:hypothetical protein
MAITIERTKDETDNDALARAFTKPSTRAAFTIEKFTPKSHGLEIGALVGQLKKQCNDDNFNVDEMLRAQAQTLDAIFNNLASIAVQNFNNLPAFEAVMKSAFQAQNQCGKTLQVISQNQQNKLLNGAKANDSVESSKTIEAIEGNKTVATLVKFDGRKISKRQKESVTKCL